MPNGFLNLYLGNTKESEHFRTYLRVYNNMFAFTSLGVTYDNVLAKRNHGIYTFKVQGQIYHFINDLVPSNQQPRNLQLYFFDDSTEMLNRMASSSILRQSVVEKLMDIVKINPYCIFLKSLMRDNEENGVLHSGRLFQQYLVDEFMKVEIQWAYDRAAIKFRRLDAYINFNLAVKIEEIDALLTIDLQVKFINKSMPMEHGRIALQHLGLVDKKYSVNIINTLFNVTLVDD
ncbi:hypothetical protein RND71_014616 [Anisodus tanguticus]|uniref:Uncharacterized protein n=1 Tax=Anisodus tanguticus TaxID=243964 RepID=A0AAE1SBL2_9SOLA|nr:hypothetical protein RND71_014616 [Anisodus tanguticus]